MKVGVIFSTVTGNTKEMAVKVAKLLGDEADAPKEISDISADAIASYDSLVVGAPTWNTGAKRERTGTVWDEFMYGDLLSVDMSGKAVAVFGLGDGIGYANNFCDGIDELHAAFEKAGAKMVGYTPIEGFDFEESKSVHDGKFVGLPIDATNRDFDEIDDLLSDWVQQIKSEGIH